MSLTATISISVPALPDNDIWFANAAAWSNYWENIPASVTINPAATAIYTPQPADLTLPIYDIQINGVDQNVPSLALVQSLYNQLAAVDQCLQDLRSQLKAAGLITQAQ